jgi:hypothetical protein
MSLGQDQPVGPSDDETARLEELRGEVARLESELGVEQATSPTPVRGGWWRGLVMGLCLVLLAITAPLAVVATWAHDEISNTDRYVATVAPLASDPAVQSAVSTKITDALVQRINVTAVSQQAVDALAQRARRPGVAVSLRALGTPLASAITNFISTKVSQFVASEEFATAWSDANREAHTQMVAILTGQGSKAVQVQGNAVQLNLSALIDAVKQRLIAAGFKLAEHIPETTATFTLFQSADLAKAQTGFRLLSDIARALPIVALLMLAGAVLAARRRRRGLLISSLVVVGSMLVLGLLLNLARSIYLGAVPSDQLPADAAAAIYDQLVWFIRLNLRALLVLFLVVAAAAWVTGPERAPSAIRRSFHHSVDVVRHRSDDAGINTGAFGTFLGAYRGVIRGVVCGLVILLYVLKSHPTGAWTLGLIVIAGVILLLVELLARPGAPAAAGPATEPSSPDGP